MGKLRGLGLGTAGLALTVGCAAGANDNGLGSGIGDGSAMMSGDDDITTSITAASVEDSGDDGSADDSQDEADEADDGPLDAADDDAGDTTGSVDPTTGGGEEDTGGATSAESGGEESSTGEEIMCPQEVTCDEAAGLGSVSGDTGSVDLQYQDTQPVWLKFQVTEDNDDIIGETLSFTATLTSPACCDFDLYVYRGPVGAADGCDGFLESSISIGAVDTVSMTWGEGLAANGVDDTSWIAVEIVPKNDECADDEPWDLLIEGDT